MKVTYGAIVQSASGRFGGTVHSNWKGVQVVRRFAKPSNPDTTAQQGVRFAFLNLTRSFLLMTTNVRAAWDSFVVGKPLINRNAFLGKNVPLMGAGSPTSVLLATPGDSSTLAPANAVPTGGVGQITFVVDAPAVPTGWTLTAVVTACVPSQTLNSAPLEANELQWAEATDATAPYTGATITGLAADTYATFAFIKWLAPDGSVRYSAAFQGFLVVVT